jgi:hypothetical protein
MMFNKDGHPLALEIEGILDDDMDKADEANVSTIVEVLKIMDKADMADVSAIVGLKDITSKLKFKMNFSGHRGCMLAPSPVALEDIAKSRCFVVGLVTGDKWQNDHGDTSHKKMTGDNWQNDHGDNSQGRETGSSCNRCSRRLGPKAFTRTERAQKFKKKQLRGIWCRDTTKKAQKQYCTKVAK